MKKKQKRKVKTVGNKYWQIEDTQPSNCKL